MRALVVGPSGAKYLGGVGTAVWASRVRLSSLVDLLRQVRQLPLVRRTTQDKVRHVTKGKINQVIGRERQMEIEMGIDGNEVRK